MKTFQLTQDKLSVQLTDYGAAITHFKYKTNHGIKDLVLGFDDPKDYTHPENPYFGAIIGRSCNRLD